MHQNKILLSALTAAILIPVIAEGANRRQSYVEMTAASDKVVLGTVSLKSSRWGDDSRIYTDVVLSPEVTIKGAEEGAVVIETLGGVVGDTRMTVSDGPELPEGERVIVFLSRRGDRFVVTNRSAGAIGAGSPEAGEAVEGAFSNVENSSRQRDSRRRGLAEIFMDLRGNGTGTTQNAATQNGCYIVDGAKWNTSQATYKIGSSIPAAWSASLVAAANTWNAVGAGFSLVNDQNSTNELSYLDLVAKYGSSYSNTYAVTTTWSSVSTQRISKATIEVNTKWSWSPTGQAGMADVQNIMTHEFGHWMRLLDVYSPSTCGEVTMWGTAALGETKKRTIEQADIDGFKSLYSGGTGGGPTVTAPVLASPANGATGVATSVTLSWSAVSGATSYDVYLGTSTNPVLVGTVTGTSYPASGLPAGTLHYWRVVAKNSSSSATSNTWAFTTAAATQPPPSSGPTLLSPSNGATGVSTRSPFSWTAVTGATSYELYFGTSPSGLSLIGSVNATSVTVTGFGSGTTYYWQVVARTAGGGRSPSAVWSFRTR